jgi:hypothetical protein
MPRKLVSVESYHESLLQSLKDPGNSNQYRLIRLNYSIRQRSTRTFLDGPIVAHSSK